MRQILGMDGPLNDYKVSLETLLREFEKRHETRNLLAHGFATYMVTPDGDSGLYFQKWHRHAERIDARLVRTFRLPDLKREMEDLVGIAQRGLALFFEIHSRFGWVERPYT